MNRKAILLSLLLAAPAAAQDLELSTQAIAPEGAELLATPSIAAAATSTAYVPISGTVTGTPESVAFSGQAKVSSRLARDPDFNSPRLVLTIDLSAVGGTGSATGTKYSISGPELVQRRVATSHAVEFTFPFRRGAEGPRTGSAIFAFDFDPATGVITKAAGRVDSVSLR